jgi:hypothetical protein
MSEPRIRQLVTEILERTQELQTLIGDTPGPRPPKPPGRQGDIIRVRPGDDVAAALDDLSKTGGTLLCAPGLYERVNFIGRKRPEGAPLVTITSDTTNLPKPGERITREYADGIAVFQSGTIEETFRTEHRARNYAFVGVGFGPTPHVDRTLVSLGDSRKFLTHVDDLPSGFTFDRVLMYGAPGRGQHQGIRANGRDITGMGCSFYDFAEPGRDSQAVGAWNGGHSVAWEHCYFEGSAENVMLGGSDAANEALSPRDWVFRRCVFAKNPIWKTWDRTINVKALFEIKDVRNLLMEGCIFERNWKHSWPSAVAITLKCANQEDHAPWVICENVEIRDCLIRDCGTLFQIHGYGDSGNVTRRMNRVRLRNILAYNINTNPEFCGEGKGMPCNNPPDGLTVDHVTMLANRHSFFNFWFDQNQPRGSALSWTNSIMWEGSYGVIGDKVTPNLGRGALDQAFEQVEFRGNVIVKGARNHDWGADNARLDEAAVLRSLDARKRVIDGSPVATAVRTTDGGAPGADVNKILAAVPATAI